jgi:hypothetical protein
MKRLISAALALTLILPVAPVLAGDTFHALSRLPMKAQASLTPMDEAQLAAIEGGVSVTQGNTAIANVSIAQSNSFAGGGSGSVNQSNSASVDVRITQQNTANPR